MIRYIKHLLGYKYRVVSYKTEVWSPLKREMLFVSTCTERPLRRSTMKKLLPVDMNSLLLVIWGKRPWHVSYFSSIDHLTWYCSSDNFHLREYLISGIAYSSRFVKATNNAPITFGRGRLLHSQISMQISRVGLNLSKGLFCNHPLDKMIGTVCGICGHKIQRN